jgi:hypothetical protein
MPTSGLAAPARALRDAHCPADPTVEAIAGPPTAQAFQGLTRPAGPKLLLNAEAIVERET